MTRTKSITLVYHLTQKEVIQPAQRELMRKDEWVRLLQRMVKDDTSPLEVRVTYKLVNPEVENLRRFFHTCVKYFAIQNKDMMQGEPDSHLLEQYREELLDELIGYDYQTANKVLRRRPSTEEYKTTEPWLTLLKNFEETIFDSHGYEFPASEDFWNLVKAHGYEQAQKISITQLQDRMKKRV